MKHESCMSDVLVDVTSSYKMLARVTIDKGGGGLSTAEIHVWNTKETCSELIFWCLKCNDVVSLDKIVMPCRCCDKLHPVVECVLPLETGGVWCTSCAERRCSDEACEPLETLFQNSCIKLT